MNSKELKKKALRIFEEDELKKRCDSIIWHGPGHQSKTYCHVKGKHTIHRATYGSDRENASWKGKEAYSGFFDEPPNVD
jgi:hypothetical protein